MTEHDGPTQSEVPPEGPDSLSSRSRWFISAPVRSNLGPLIARLRERGGRPFVLSDVAAPGDSLLSSIRSAINAADMVLVVLDAKAPSLNSVFEAGIAVGYGKPLVILADPQVVVPSDFANFLTIHARPDDFDAIDFALNQLDRVERRPSAETRPVVATDRSLGSRASDMLEQLRFIVPLTERAALIVLTEAIEASGAVPAQGNSDYGVDLGVWSDDLDTIGANPLFIEIKQSLDRQTVAQVSAYLSDGRYGRLALVVYLDRSISSSAALRLLPYPILAVSLHELLNRMQTSSFAEVVRQLRNVSVHQRPVP